MPKRKSQDSSESVDDVDFAISVPAGSDGTVTARKAGGIADLELSISPTVLGEKKAKWGGRKARRKLCFSCRKPSLNMCFTMPKIYYIFSVSVNS